MGGAPAGDELEALLLEATAAVGSVAAVGSAAFVLFSPVKGPLAATLSGDSSGFIPWRPVLAVRAPAASSSPGADFDKDGDDEAVGDCGEDAEPNAAFFAIDSAMAFAASDAGAVVDGELPLEAAGREAAALAVFALSFVDSAGAFAKSPAPCIVAATLEGLFSDGVAGLEATATSLGIDGTGGAPTAGASGSLPRCSRTRIS